MAVETDLGVTILEASASGTCCSAFRQAFFLQLRFSSVCLRRLHSPLGSVMLLSSCLHVDRTPTNSSVSFAVFTSTVFRSHLHIYL